MNKLLEQVKFVIFEKVILLVLSIVWFQPVQVTFIVIFPVIVTFVVELSFVKFNAEKLNNQLELTQQQLELRSSNALKQIDIQSNSLKIAQEQLKLAENIYGQTAAKFEQGVASSNDLITAENALQQDKTTVVASYIQLRQAELDYLKSIGSIK